MIPRRSSKTFPIKPLPTGTAAPVGASLSKGPWNDSGTSTPSRSTKITPCAAGTSSTASDTTFRSIRSGSRSTLMSRTASSIAASSAARRSSPSRRAAGRGRSRGTRPGSAATPFRGEGMGAAWPPKQTIPPADRRSARGAAAQRTSGAPSARRTAEAGDGSLSKSWISIWLPNKKTRSHGAGEGPPPRRRGRGPPAPPRARSAEARPRRRRWRLPAIAGQDLRRLVEEAVGADRGAGLGEDRGGDPPHDLARRFVDRQIADITQKCLAPVDLRAREVR